MGLEKVRMGGDMSIAVLIEAVDYITIIVFKCAYLDQYYF